MPTVLITGASGYLAHRLMPIVANHAEVVGVARNADAIVGEYARHTADVSEYASIRAVIDAVKPTAIIHAAASNPGQDVEAMETVNFKGAANIAKIAAQLAIRVVNVSTDVVHNGVDAPFADAAAADPQNGNEYGRTKAMGEQAMLTSNASAVIVRTSLIYGLEEMDRGTSGFVERLKKGETLKLFSDVLRQPVWVDTLSKALCTLALEKTDVEGILNVVGSEVLSRAEFAYSLMDFWGINYNRSVEEISGKQIPGLPMDLRMKLDRAHNLGLDVPGVSEVLASYGIGSKPGCE